MTGTSEADGMTEHEDSFFAMNTDIDTILEADFPVPWLLLSVRLLFEQQEARFSRFREESLLSALNRGETVADPWMVMACELALEAHDATDGMFNPMVLPALAQAGYGESFAPGVRGNPTAQSVPDPNDCLVIEAGTVSLQSGQLDLGGIVKGWTADLAVELLAEDVPNAFVNAGGDMRCIGGQGEGGWTVAIEAPISGQVIWEGRLFGGLATSTSMKRRWRTLDGREAHHLVDPRTGLPAESPFVQVSVFAETARVAECWAKAVLIGGEPAVQPALAAGVSLLTLDNEGHSQLCEG